MKSEEMTYGSWSRCSWGRLNQALALLALVSALLLTACSDDLGQDGKRSVTVEAIPCAQQFVEVEPMSFTRAWIPPSPFVPLSTLNAGYDNQSYIMSNTMEIFFTNDAGEEQLDALFSYTGRQWRASLKDDDIKVGTSYYLYGYIPYISSVSASVSKLPESSNYSEGAVLTLNGMPTVTASDVCVVVGAKNGKSNYTADANYSVTGLTPGNFTYTATDGDNYIYLLFDHIYSGLQLSFCVDATYAALRTIKLKKLELQAYDNSTTPQVMKRKVLVTIPLSAGSSSPVGDISYSTAESNELMNSVPIYGEKATDPAVVLPSEGDKTFKNFFCGFMPHEVSNFKLTSTYDVYDTKMNLIRSDCKAENMLYFDKIFTRFDGTKRGRKYVISLTIKPTFLYMLSEPDLNSPTAVVYSGN